MNRCDACGRELVEENPGEGQAFRGWHLQDGLPALAEFGVGEIFFCRDCDASFPADDGLTAKNAWVRGYLEVRKNKAYHAGQALAQRGRTPGLLVEQSPPGDVPQF